MVGVVDLKGCLFVQARISSFCGRALQQQQLERRERVLRIDLCFDFDLTTFFSRLFLFIWSGSLFIGIFKGLRSREVEGKIPRV